MKIGETIQGHDLARALRGEQGKFEVTTPSGDTLYVTCKPGHSIANLEMGGSKRSQPQAFVINKVADLVPTAGEVGETRNGWET